MPVTVRQVLHGAVSSIFVKECVCACREISSGACADAVTDMLSRASREEGKLTGVLMEEVMQQYNSVNSGELKNLSTLLVELLVSQSF